MKIEKTLNCTILLWHESSVMEKLSIFLTIRKLFSISKTVKEKSMDRDDQNNKDLTLRSIFIWGSVEKKKKTNSRQR